MDLISGHEQVNFVFQELEFGCSEINANFESNLRSSRMHLTDSSSSDANSQ